MTEPPDERPPLTLACDALRPLVEGANLPDVDDARVALSQGRVPAHVATPVLAALLAYVPSRLRILVQRGTAAAGALGDQRTGDRRLGLAVAG